MVAKLNSLVVVIPGIGGSILEDDRGVVWDTTAGDMLEALRDPRRLAIDRPLRPVGLIGDFALLPGWALIQGYGDLVARIHKSVSDFRLDDGHPERAVPDANVVLFPYDFRRSVEETAEALDRAVRWRVRRMFGTDDRRKVLVVAHSLGGLVARYWLGALGAAPICRALITIGTPHRGAPKALDWLVNGVQAGPFRLRDAAQVFRAWPSALELLPRYRAIANGPDGAAYYPHELAGEMGLDPVSTKRAFDCHLRIEAAWSRLAKTPDDAPEVVPLVGSGHATTESATWARGGPLVVSKEPAPWLDPTCIRGDGTVPAISAVPIELSDHPGRWRQETLRHLPLASADCIGPLLVQLNSSGLWAVRGHEVGRCPQVCLDVEEAYASGSPVQVTANLRGCPTEGARLWLELESKERLFRRTEMERSGGARWVTEVKGLGAGLHEVRVSASGLRVAVSDAWDTVAVVEP